jgi:hemerythrin-like metal-binding protein
MGIVTWSDELYGIGHETIDGQHKRLIQMINDLHDSLAKGRVTEGMKATLKGIVEYTQTHFADEEKIMEELGWPELDEHRRKHHALLRDVRKMLMRLKSGETVGPFELLGFLRQWLLEHIEGEDLKLRKVMQTSSRTKSPKPA